MLAPAPAHDSRRSLGGGEPLIGGSRLPGPPCPRRGRSARKDSVSGAPARRRRLRSCRRLAPACPRDEPWPQPSPSPPHAATRSASNIDLFALPATELAKPAAELPAAPVPPSAEQQQQQLAALKEAVQAKVVVAKQREAAELVAGVAAKYGLAADYGKAEQTIKAVWAEQVRRRCSSVSGPGCCLPLRSMQPAGRLAQSDALTALPCCSSSFTVLHSNCLICHLVSRRAAPPAPTLLPPSPPRSRLQPRS